VTTLCGGAVLHLAILYHEPSILLHPPKKDFIVRFEIGIQFVYTQTGLSSSFSLRVPVSKVNSPLTSHQLVAPPSNFRDTYKTPQNPRSRETAPASCNTQDAAQP
jgi:hypothetical protein